MNEIEHASTTVVRLSCGRRLSFRRYGAPGGRPVLALHGTPGSHLKFAGAAAAAARSLGLELIALDRWGYGATNIPSEPGLSLFAEDVAGLADQLRLDHFAVLGISGGGPFAAATAALLGSRVTASALIAPVGPVRGITPSPRLDPWHHVAFNWLPRTPGILPSAFGLLRLIARRRPDLATRLAAGRAGAPDRALARDPEFARELGQAFAAGLEAGARGPVIDLALFSRAWNVALDTTSAPTRIWIGDQDRNVPLDAVTALAREIARGTATPEVVKLTGHGHFWIARNFTHVLGWIAAQPGMCR